MTRTTKTLFGILTVVVILSAAYLAYANPALFHSNDTALTSATTTPAAVEASTTATSSEVSKSATASSAGNFIKGNYKREGNQIFIAVGAPTESWKPLDADAETFVVLMEGDNEVVPAYAKDKYRVYKDSSIIPEADAATFKLLADNGRGGQIAADKNALYMDDQRVVVPDALLYRPASSDPVSSGAVFLAKGSELYTLTKTRGPINGKIVLDVPQLIPGGDPATLEPLLDKTMGWGEPRDVIARPIYYKDSNHVYCDGEVLTGADPKTIQILPIVPSTYATVDELLKKAVARDANHGYNEQCTEVE